MIKEMQHWWKLLSKTFFNVLLSILCSSPLISIHYILCIIIFLFLLKRYPFSLSVCVCFCMKIVNIVGIWWANILNLTSVVLYCMFYLCTSKWSHTYTPSHAQFHGFMVSHHCRTETPVYITDVKWSDMIGLQSNDKL